ncbi:MAG: DUF6019 family protein [Agriterribacter sp.]
MESSDLIFYLIGAIVAWIIFYHVVKAAVRNGIREARKDLEAPVKPVQEKAPNARQLQLKEKYDKGEITFETYKAEWEKS